MYLRAGGGGCGEPHGEEAAEDDAEREAAASRRSCHFDAQSQHVQPQQGQRAFTGRAGGARSVGLA